MPHTVEWKVHLYLFEDEGRTKARVELDTGAAALTGRGTARLSPDDDRDIPVIGDELAAGRALSDLGQQLLRAAEHDIEAEEPPAPRRPRPGYGWVV
jgi:hypothetical protein